MDETLKISVRGEKIGNIFTSVIATEHHEQVNVFEYLITLQRCIMMTVILVF